MQWNVRQAVTRNKAVDCADKFWYVHSICEPFEFAESRIPIGKQVDAIKELTRTVYLRLISLLLR